MADSGIEDIEYWVTLTVTHLNEGQALAELGIPPHILSNELYNQLLAQELGTSDAIEEAVAENDRKIYDEDVEHGIDYLEEQPLGVGDELPVGTFRYTGSQATPFDRHMDLNEYLVQQENIEDDTTRVTFERENKDNQTDHLPHLFKRQKVYEHISGDFERSIAAAIAGDKKYFLARLRTRVSGSMFRDLAGTPNAEDEVLAEDITREGVIERRIDNLNPFNGKFVFKTAYGPPPTASLSKSADTIIMIKDLGNPDFGPEYTIYNTSTGSLHSSSFLYAQGGGDVKINGIPHGTLGEEVTPFVTTGSEIKISFKRSPGNLAYKGKWEQKFATSSTATLNMSYETIQPEYNIIARNGKPHKTIHTNKTVNFNGKIFIT